MVAAGPPSSSGARARVVRRGGSARGSRRLGFCGARRCGGGHAHGTFAGAAAAPSSARMTSWLRRMRSSRCKIQWSAQCAPRLESVRV